MKNKNIMKQWHSHQTNRMNKCKGMRIMTLKDLEKY